jgi:hypothetical protein
MKAAAAIEPPAGNVRLAGMTRILPYDGRTIGQAQSVWVYLPPSYEPEKAYPIVYLLLCPGNADMQWFLTAGASDTLDRLIANRRIPPMVVAAPVGEGPRAPQAAVDELFNGVMPLIERAFSISASPGDQAMIAVSADEAPAGCSPGLHYTVSTTVPAAHRTPLFQSLERRAAQVVDGRRPPILWVVVSGVEAGRPAQEHYLAETAPLLFR